LHPVCITPAKAEPDKVSVTTQTPRTLRRAFTGILLRKEGVLRMGLQRTPSISQSSRRMIAPAPAKDKALASLLAKTLTPSPLEVTRGARSRSGGAPSKSLARRQEGVLC
jgi:hypothetical protein